VRLNTFESLGIRDYRLLWLGQLSTSMGQWMDQVTRAWLIYQMTNSSLQLGFVSAIRGIPLLLFGTVAGVVADRYSRKAQLIIAQVVNALLNVILATLVLTHTVHPWHVYVTGFLAGTVQAFQQPARQVLINDLVGEKHLLNAISLNSAAANLSRSFGPAISGGLIALLGVDMSYYTQAALYAFATVWTVQIHLPESSNSATLQRNAVKSTLFDSTKEGFSYIAAHPLILGLMVLGLAPIVLGMPFQSLMPIFAIDIFHGGAPTQGMLLTLLGLGAVLGALIIASSGRQQGSGKLMMLGAGGFGISLVLFSQSPVIWLAGLFILFAGISNSAFGTQNQTLIQIMVPSEIRGRVLGIYLLDRGLMPLGSLLAGSLAAWLGGRVAVLIMGIACFLLVLTIRVFVPKIWHLNMEFAKHQQLEV
jgi:MFS family permease